MALNFFLGGFKKYIKIQTLFISVFIGKSSLRSKNIYSAPIRFLRLTLSATS